MAIGGVSGNQEPQDINKLKGKQPEAEKETKETKDAPAGSTTPSVFAAADNDKNGTISTAEQKGGMKPIDIGQMIKQGLAAVKPQDDVFNKIASSALSKLSSMLTDVKTDGTQESADKADKTVAENQKNAIEAVKAEVQSEIKKAEAEAKTSEMDAEVKKDFDTAT